MHQKSDELSPRLEALLLSKAFDALHPEELQYVAQHLNEDEYRQYRQLLLQSQELFETDVPPAMNPLSERLQDALTQRKPKGWLERIQQLATYRVPLWQASLAMLLLSFAFFQFQLNPPAETIASNPVEKLPSEEKVIEAAPVLSEDPKSSKEGKLAPLQRTSPPVREVVDSPLIAYIDNNPNDSSRFASRSFSRDRELMDLRVEMK